MRFIEKVAVSVLRPVYRAFFEKPLWWFLAKLKAFFIADLSAQVQAIREEQARHLAAVDERLQRLDERLRRLEAGDPAQWNSLEQLLLSLFHQSESQSVLVTEREPGTPREVSSSSAPQLNRVHAASNIR